MKEHSGWRSKRNFRKVDQDCLSIYSICSLFSWRLCISMYHFSRQPRGCYELDVQAPIVCIVACRAA